MIHIRPAGAADGLAIAQIRAESWRVAYAGVLPAETLAELTAPAAVAQEAEWRSAHPMDGVLIAEAAGESGEVGAEQEAGGLIGFAAFGPERGEDDEPGWPGPQPPEHGRAELYAIYVVPGHWSAGAGRALMDGVLALVASSGYTDISLWVMEANERARRFYELAGFRVTGESAVLDRLAGVTQIRYRRLVG
jgi:ribosomal protein S18 acetylase RimI-like enzyme